MKKKPRTKIEKDRKTGMIYTLGLNIVWKKIEERRDHDASDGLNKIISTGKEISFTHNSVIQHHPSFYILCFVY